MRQAIPALLSLLAVSAYAQPSILTPQVGCMQDAAGFVRPVYGLAANFLIGEPIAAGVLSAGFSGSFGWAKTDSALLVVDSQGQAIAASDAPPGPALFAFTSDGKPAFGYLIATSTLLQWKNASLTSVPFDWPAIAAEAVLSIAAPDPDHVAMLVQRADDVWDLRIRLATGEVDSQTALPGISVPAHMLSTGDVVSVDDSGLVLRRADGSVVPIAGPLPESFTIQQMGDGWLQLLNRTNAEQFAVRISKDREGYYALPEVNQ